MGTGKSKPLDFKQVNIWHQGMCERWRNGAGSRILATIEGKSYDIMTLANEEEAGKAIEMHNAWLDKVENVVTMGANVVDVLKAFDAFKEKYDVVKGANAWDKATEVEWQTLMRHIELLRESALRVDDDIAEAEKTLEGKAE